MSETEELKIIAQNTENRFQRLENAVSDYRADMAVVKSKLNTISYAAGASLVGIIGLIIGLIAHMV